MTRVTAILGSNSRMSNTVSDEMPSASDNTTVQPDDTTARTGTNNLVSNTVSPELPASSDNTPGPTDNTKAGSGTEFTVVINNRPSLPPWYPTIQEVIKLIIDLFTSIIKPSYDHKIWAQSLPIPNEFPDHAAAMINLITSLPPDLLNTGFLQKVFITFIKAFCEIEMRIHIVNDPKKSVFNIPKWGAFCQYRRRWILEAPWVRRIYAMRNEWSWGGPGGVRGDAGFVEAVAMFTHCFVQMLEQGLLAYTKMKSKNGLPKAPALYGRACWEMREYVWKWANRNQPPVDIVPAVASPSCSGHCSPTGTCFDDFENDYPENFSSDYQADDGQNSWSYDDSGFQPFFADETSALDQPGLEPDIEEPDNTISADSTIAPDADTAGDLGNKKLNLAVDTEDDDDEEVSCLFRKATLGEQR